MMIFSKCRKSSARRRDLLKLGAGVMMIPTLSKSKTSEAASPGEMPLPYLVVSNLAALQMLSKPCPVVQLLGRDIVGDGGEGLFAWRDGKAAEDGAVVVNSKVRSEGYWLRIHDGTLNVRWFGAQGDGENDDGSALNRALRHGSGYRRVVLPPGVYNSSIPLNIYSNTSIDCFGELRLTKSSIAGGFVLVKSDVHDVIWRGGVVNCNGQPGMNGIAIGQNIDSRETKAQNIRFSQITVSNAQSASAPGGFNRYGSGGKGITVQFHVDGVIITDFICRDCTVGLSVEAARGGDRTTENVIIADGLVQNSGVVGIYLSGSLPAGAQPLSGWGRDETKFGACSVHRVIIDDPNLSASEDGGAIVCNFANFADIDVTVRASSRADHVTLIRGNMTHSRVRILAAADSLRSAVNLTPTAGASLGTLPTVAVDIESIVFVKTEVSEKLINADNTLNSLVKITYDGPPVQSNETAVSESGAQLLIRNMRN